MQADILQLMRDHDLLRTLLGEIEQIVAAHGWVAGIVERFEAMLLLNAIHSRTEEQCLLGGEGRAPDDQRARVAFAGGYPPDAPTRGALPCDETDDVYEEQLPDTPTSGADDNGIGGTDLPLAVAYPRLYRLAIERLGERGIQPGDLRLIVRRGNGTDDLHYTESRLIAAFGHGFRQTLELPLSAVSNHLAVEQALNEIADACERAVRAEYFEAMQITEPGAPGAGSRDGKRAQFSLTVLDPPKGVRE